MRPEDIPQELIDILDNAAGRKHSRTGSVAAALAQILTRHAEMLTPEGMEKSDADASASDTRGFPSKDG